MDKWLNKNQIHLEGYHHVYMTKNVKTDEFYIGASYKKGKRNVDVYLGHFTYKPWKELKDKSCLKKQILAYGFKNPKETLDYEAQLINSFFDHPKNINLNNPIDGFYNYRAGFKHTTEWKTYMSNLYAGTVSVFKEDDSEKKVFRVPKKEFRSNNTLLSATSKNPYWKGKKMSDKLRKKLSKAQKGKHCGEKNPMYGLYGSDNPTSKKVQCLQDNCCNNKIFRSQVECAEYHNYTVSSSVSHHCLGKYVNQKFKFV